jgi:hypothetical protein
VRLAGEFGSRGSRSKSPGNWDGRKTKRVSKYEVYVYKKESDWLVSLGGAAAPFKIWPIAAQSRATTDTPSDSLLSGSHRTYVRRPPASVPLQDADSKLPNVNWVRGNRHAPNGLGRRSSSTTRS